MTESRQTSLDVASRNDIGLLANLLELYLHDLSSSFPITPGADGRFGYANLPLYWSEPDRRFPFLIKYGAATVGFVLITVGSPASEDPHVLDVAEFFVLRGYRRSGVGREAAALVWNRLPGRWCVRVLEANAGALNFWARVIAEYTGDRAIEWRRPGPPSSWRVFAFSSPPVTG
jgi:predicted acetyltransferase